MRQLKVVFIGHSFRFDYPKIIEESSMKKVISKYYPEEDLRCEGVMIFNKNIFNKCRILIKVAPEAYDFNKSKELKGDIMRYLGLSECILTLTKVKDEPACEERICRI